MIWLRTLPPVLTRATFAGPHSAAAALHVVRSLVELQVLDLFVGVGGRRLVGRVLTWFYHVLAPVACCLACPASLPGAVALRGKHTTEAAPTDPDLSDLQPVLGLVADAYRPRGAGDHHAVRVERRPVHRLIARVAGPGGVPTTVP